MNTMLFFTALVSALILAMGMGSPILAQGDITAIAGSNYQADSSNMSTQGKITIQAGKKITLTNTTLHAPQGIFMVVGDTRCNLPSTTGNDTFVCNGEVPGTMTCLLYHEDVCAAEYTNCKQSKSSCGVENNAGNNAATSPQHKSNASVLLPTPTLWIMLTLLLFTTSPFSLMSW